MPKFKVQIVTPNDIIIGDEAMLGDVKISGDLKDEYLYDIITKIDGRLTLTGAQAKKLIELDSSTLRFEPCMVLIYKIIAGGQEVQVARATFSLLESDFDVDKCVVKVKLTSADHYQAYEVGKGREWNLLDAIPVYNDRYFITFGTPLQILRNGIPLKTALLYLYRKINPTGNVSTPPFVWYKYYSLILYQKSDIIRRNIAGFQPSTKLPATLERLLQDVCKMFNLVWKITAQGDLIIDTEANIENLNFYFDLTTAARSKQIFHKGQYGYNSQKVTKRERYLNKESKNLDFVGAPIEYENALTNAMVKDAEQKTEIEFITDLEYIMSLDPLDDALDYEGIVMVASQNGGGGVFTSPTILDTADRLNNVLSWAVLHEDNFKERRLFKAGKMNNAAAVFNSVRKTKEQKGVKFILCNDDFIDFNKGIKTQFGVGKVAKYSWLLSKGEVSCDLIFEPTETLVINVERGWNKTYSSYQDLIYTQGVQDGLLDDQQNQTSLSGQIVAQSITSAAGASVTLNADGSFVYIPVTGYYGQDTFTAIYQDTNGYYSLCTIKIVVMLAMVYVHEEYTSNCQNNPQNGSEQYTAFWYEDAAGTIPIDVTGYNFNLEFGPNPDTVQVQGTSQVYYDYYCGSGNYSIQPHSGNRYTII